MGEGFPRREGVRRAGQPEAKGGEERAGEEDGEGVLPLGRRQEGRSGGVIGNDAFFCGVGILTLHLCTATVVRRSHERGCKDVDDKTVKDTLNFGQHVGAKYL